MGYDIVQCPYPACMKAFPVTEGRLTPQDVRSAYMKKKSKDGPPPGNGMYDEADIDRDVDRDMAFDSALESHDDGFKTASASEKKSRRFELKQKLMRRAWDGESSLAESGADMIKLIQMRLARWTEIPEEHQRILNESRLLNMDQPRSVQMLNAIAVHKGKATRFSLHEGTETVH